MALLTSTHLSVAPAHTVQPVSFSRSASLPLRQKLRTYDCALHLRAWWACLFRHRCSVHHIARSKGTIIRQQCLFIAMPTWPLPLINCKPQLLTHGGRRSHRLNQPLSAVLVHALNVGIHEVASRGSMVALQVIAEGVQLCHAQEVTTRTVATVSAWRRQVLAVQG